MPRKDEPSVPATIVDLDPELDPVPAAIVVDRRRMLGRRIGIFALVMLVLFYVISGYISSSQNTGLLHRAAQDRSNLVESVHHLSQTNDAQTILIKQLQAALRAQNKILRAAGFQTVFIPGTNPSPQPGVSPNPRPSPHPSSSSKPKPSHSPSASPSPSNTVDQIRQKVCDLTGICTDLNIIWFLRL